MSILDQVRDLIRKQNLAIIAATGNAPTAEGTRANLAALKLLQKATGIIEEAQRTLVPWELTDDEMRTQRLQLATAIKPPNRPKSQPTANAADWTDLPQNTPTPAPKTK